MRDSMRSFIVWFRKSEHNEFFISSSRRLKLMLSSTLSSALKRCTTPRNVKVSSSSESNFPFSRLSISPNLLPLYSQGYAFKVITSLEGLNQLDNLVYPTKAEQIELLQSVLLASESDADLGTDVTAKKDDLAGTITSKSFGGPTAANGGGGGRKDGAGQATRVAGSLQALSGWVLALTYPLLLRDADSVQR